MISRKPEGYKDLLAYQRAAEVQVMTLALTIFFPKTKTFLDLKDQMDRSGRSGTKNIIEGWKRNTTKEYFDFLGFSIGAIEELKDDAADIAKGLYRELRAIRELWEPRGVMGERGKMGRLTPFQPLTPSSSPIQPFHPITPFTESQLISFRFYPADPVLPPIVQLYLKCKEVLMLLNKLQKSLDSKMDEDKTRPVNEMIRRRMVSDAGADRKLDKFIENTGLIRLQNGSFIQKEEYERRKAAGEDIRLFGE